MSLFKLPHKSWVVVCDGARALFMENIGDAERLNLRVAERFYSIPSGKVNLLGFRPIRIAE